MVFTVINTKIQGEKTLSIDEERKIKLSFLFEDSNFQDNDNFALTLGDAYSFNYAFNNQGYLSFRDVDVSQIITKSEQTFAIKVYQGEDLILDDNLTIDAIVGDVDLSAYVTNDGLSSALSDYATTTYANSLINNKLKINTITDDTDTIALAYTGDYDIIQVDNTTENASLTINPCTGYTAVNGEIPTFELWIKPTTKKTTISISNSIKQVGDMPEQLDADAIHCFVFRFTGQDQLLNYSYSFTPTASSESSAE